MSLMRNCWGGSQVETAAKRVIELIRSRQSTRPQRVELLKQLREGQGVSQVELAELLGVKQPTVSKMERQRVVRMKPLFGFAESQRNASPTQSWSCMK